MIELTNAEVLRVLAGEPIANMLSKEQLVALALNQAQATQTTKPKKTRESLKVKPPEAGNNENAEGGEEKKEKEHGPYWTEKAMIRENAPPRQYVIRDEREKEAIKNLCKLIFDVDGNIWNEERHSDGDLIQTKMRQPEAAQALGRGCTALKWHCAVISNCSKILTFEIVDDEALIRRNRSAVSKRKLKTERLKVIRQCCKYSFWYRHGNSAEQPDKFAPTCVPEKYHAFIQERYLKKHGKPMPESELATYFNKDSKRKGYFFTECLMKSKAIKECVGMLMSGEEDWLK